MELSENRHFIVLIVFLALVLVDGQDVTQKHDQTVCTNSYARLDCGEKRIHILRAFSGKPRPPANPTPSCYARPGDETYNNSKAVLNAWKNCNMRPNCQVFLDDGNYYTYVFLRYQCISDIPAYNMCSNVTSIKFTRGFIFSPGYPLIIPSKHQPRCSCHINSQTKLNFRMDIHFDELRCTTLHSSIQRINVRTAATLRSSYTCFTLNRAPLFIFNTKDIDLDFKNDYYAQGGRFWIRIEGDKEMTLKCGQGSPVSQEMSPMIKVERIKLADVNQEPPKHPGSTPSVGSPATITIRDSHTHKQATKYVHSNDNSSPDRAGAVKLSNEKLELVVGVLVTSTVLLAITLTLYICWQRNIRKKKAQKALQPFTMITADEKKISM